MEPSVRDVSEATLNLLLALYRAKGTTWPYGEAELPDPRETTVERLLLLLFQAIDHDPGEGWVPVRDISYVHEPRRVPGRSGTSVIIDQDPKDRNTRIVAEVVQRLLEAMIETRVLDAHTVREILMETVKRLESKRRDSPSTTVQ